MSHPGKIIVVTAHMEFPMCPTVVIGTTPDGETILARYRWGRLTVRLDPPNAPCGAAAGAWIYDEQLDPEALAGCLDYDELRELTAEILEWPEEITPKTYDVGEATTWPDDYEG